MLAILKPDFSGVEKSEFPRLRSPSGEEYLRINFNLVMTFDTMIAFKLEYKGRLAPGIPQWYLPTRLTHPVATGRIRGDVTADYIEAGALQPDNI